MRSGDIVESGTLQAFFDREIRHHEDIILIGADQFAPFWQIHQSREMGCSSLEQSDQSDRYRGKSRVTSVWPITQTLAAPATSDSLKEFAGNDPPVSHQWIIDADPLHVSGGPVDVTADHLATRGHERRDGLDRWAFIGNGDTVGSRERGNLTGRSSLTSFTSRQTTMTLDPRF
jgi:hypothetical protein